MTDEYILSTKKFTALLYKPRCLWSRYDSLKDRERDIRRIVCIWCQMCWDEDRFSTWTLLLYMFSVWNIEFKSYIVKSVRRLCVLVDDKTERITAVWIFLKLNWKRIEILLSTSGCWMGVDLYRKRGRYSSSITYTFHRRSNQVLVDF